MKKNNFNKFLNLFRTCSRLRMSFTSLPPPPPTVVDMVIFTYLHIKLQHLEWPWCGTIPNTPQPTPSKWWLTVCICSELVLFGHTWLSLFKTVSFGLNIMRQLKMFYALCWEYWVIPNWTKYTLFLLNNDQLL